MASGIRQQDQVEAASESAHFLILLSPPLASFEDVRGILGIAPEQEVERLSDYGEVTDPRIIAKYFGEKGSKAVLLSAATAKIMREYADRHKAVYAMDMVALEETDLPAVTMNILNVYLQTWLFVPEAAASTVYLQKGIVQRSAEVIRIPSAQHEAGSSTQQGCSSSSSNSKSATPSDVSSSTDRLKRKLRPARDILNRLRHDSAFKADDFRVVYEDRFEGELTLGLEQWLSESSEEEFIPQHRILRFERKWDGMPIWNRQNRLDLLFDQDCRQRYTVPGVAVRVGTLAQLKAHLNTGIPHPWHRLRRAYVELNHWPEGSENGILILPSL